MCVYTYKFHELIRLELYLQLDSIGLGRVDCMAIKSDQSRFGSWSASYSLDALEQVRELLFYHLSNRDNNRAYCIRIKRGDINTYIFIQLINLKISTSNFISFSAPYGLNFVSAFINVISHPHNKFAKYFTNERIRNSKRLSNLTQIAQNWNNKPLPLN